MMDSAYFRLLLHATTLRPPSAGQGGATGQADEEDDQDCVVREEEVEVEG